MRTDALQSTSSIIPILFTLLFGFFPGSIKRLDGKISDFAGKTFSRSLFRFAEEKCPFLINKKVIYSLARIAEKHGKSVFTYLPLSLVKELPEDTPFSLKNRVGILKKFIRHKEPINRLPFSGDITEALLKLSPKETVLFIDTALYRIRNLSNISFDFDKIRKVAEVYAVANHTHDASLIKYKLGLLESFIGKDEIEIRITILQKIDEVFRKGIAASEEPEETIRKVCLSAKDSFKTIFTILYLLSLRKNFHTAEFLRLIEKGTMIRPSREGMVNFYLNMRKAVK